MGLKKIAKNVFVVISFQNLEKLKLLRLNGHVNILKVEILILINKKDVQIQVDLIY